MKHISVEHHDRQDGKQSRQARREFSGRDSSAPAFLSGQAWLLLPLCAAAGLLALLIAWLTVAGNTLRAASAKPVLALRYE